MKRYLKTGLVLSLAFIMTISQVTMVGFAANGNNGKGKGNDKAISNVIKVKGVSEEAKTELRNRLKLMVSIGDGTWEGIPEGLAKKGYLPYGLAKRYMNKSFPYGLLKRMNEFQYGQKPVEQEENIQLEKLEKLIKSAEYRLSVDNKKVYDAATKLALTNAIAVAKGVALKTDPTALELKTAYDNLKIAIDLFDGLELVGEAYYIKLAELQVELKDYRTKFLVTYDEENATQLAHMNALNTLIATIEKYLGVDKGKMTLNAYNKIVQDAKAFEDYFDSLKALVKDAKAFLYNSNGSLKIALGNEPGQYQVAHYNIFISEIALAEAVITADPAKTFAEVTIAFNELKEAFDLFKIRKVLGVEALNTFKLLHTELEDAYARLADGTSKTALSVIIASMNNFIVSPLVYPLTQEVMNEYLDKANVYLPDLYDAIVLEIKDLIATADDFLITYEATYADFDEADKLVLDGLKDIINDANVDAKAYILIEAPTYVELMNHHKALDDAIDVFNTKVADFTLIKKNTLTDMVVDFEAFLLAYDTVYKEPEYTVAQLDELLPLKNEIQLKTEAADDYLLAVGNKTYIVLNTHIDAMDKAMEDFNLKEATY